MRMRCWKAISPCYLWAEATYTDAKGDDAVATNMASAKSDNAVILDTTNRAPEFKVKPRVLTVAENTKPNAEENDENTLDINEMIQGNIGGPIVAVDPNGDNLTYSLGGTDGGSFSIGAGTGQISVKSGTKLNREAKSSYMMTVTATDPDGASDSVDVTIMVRNVDEAPMIMVGGLAITGPSSVSYAENGTAVVATYALAGPNERLSYVIPGGRRRR